MMPLRTAIISGLLFCAQAVAAPQHALTLYDEPPKYPANFKHVDYVNPDAPKGGTFREAAMGSFDSLNPFISKGVPADNITLVYDTLAQQGLDEPITEYGLIAGKIEKAPDNSWVRFYLRPEARFHDGHPVHAEDVVFTFETLITQGSPIYRTYYADVAEVIAEDPLRVLFKFKHTSNRELPLILGQLPVLPKHWWAGRDFAKSSLEIPLGSGPYKVAEVKPGRSIRYERVKDYWGKDLPVNKGLYNFDYRVSDYYRDSTVALEALKAGQFDYWQEMTAKNWANAYNVPAVAEGRLIKEELPNGNPTGMQGFVFNIRKPMFQDVRVRKAISLLMDFEWTNKQLFNGAYTRTRSYFENSDMAATGLPSPAELAILEPLRGRIPDEAFTQAFAPAKTDASGMIRTQQREAYQLLQEAGWRIVDDKMVDTTGKPVSIEFMLAQTDFERILLPFKRNLADLGIELVIRRVDVSQYVNRVRSRDFDMMVGSFPQSSSPGNEQREFWQSSSADKPGSRNYIGLKDPAIDELVEQLINADSRNSLVAHAKALDRVLQFGYYVIPNWHIKTYRVAYWNHLGHPKVPPRYDVGIATWWIKPDQAPAVTPQPQTTADPASGGD
ncbi:ABC transporter substrate-binding protein [Pseudomonas sp. MF6784]|jgi:microcin C transport system substrate-binding protein|uniref:extracellular solute-binding protein n=1 Tax=Pseudomonas TaxID=286 RepID=UPI0007172FD2|nr:MULTISPECIES: extracellular solute-binding protein [Pseudomonas]MDZ4303963.1 extracellular solute-binding protein [Pseudomonas sp.]MBJ2254408.1 ABC transporter substrate-binding protein [Pseudomonas sp. MF6784]MBJ2260548.1 ABC transporter substrate-binding protein [Pseudomonas sp. MF6787]MBK3457006.1 ABC transporter substrate-binding protein [Pseudomonas sp. MF6754]MDI3204084.1 extracellular solute-binding protein [Pseudomonas shahriarae]